MPTVIPVKFKYAARDLWFDAADTEAQEADHVICATERGHEIGLATADAREMSSEEIGEATNHSQLRPVLRVATDEDLERAELLAEKGDEAMPIFRRLVSASGLDMKPVGVEYLFDGEKVVCYFAAEERVDFRQLVRDLAHELHERIDMRQIGVREEAAIVGGWGHCGQELCCTRFGLAFEPVSIRMAKEQDLPLNSTKISGACGRLMCCLRYEFEAYRDFKSRAPKRNAVIDTPIGKGKIIEYDTPKEQICLRLENGKQIRVPLAYMTASDAAVKKSQDLGCACRPDTVSREMLEKLDSPDVQMALAELDRKNGVLPDDEVVDEADIFVNQPKRRRHRENADAGESAETRQANASSDDSVTPASTGETRTRHRRKNRAAHLAASSSEGSAQANAEKGSASKGEATAAVPKNTRRRRHHLAGTSADGSKQASESARESRQTADANAQPAQPRRARHTRRPGDHGGAAAEQRDARPSKNTSNSAPQGQAATTADGTAAPKKRHRRRGGRGRGKGGQGQNQGGKNQGQSPDSPNNSGGAQGGQE